MSSPDRFQTRGKMTSTIGPDDLLKVADVSRRSRAIFVGSIGNLVEWYDFYA